MNYQHYPEGREDRIVHKSSSSKLEMMIWMQKQKKNDFLKRIISRIEFSRENGSEFILDIDLHQ